MKKDKKKNIRMKIYKKKRKKKVKKINCLIYYKHAK